MSILDVLQIFGRAGRPQYDNTGHAILITPHKSLNNYCALLGHQVGIDVGGRSSWIHTLLTSSNPL